MTLAAAPLTAQPVERLSPARQAARMARDARTHEDAGHYGAALRIQKELRARIAPDADLELMVALNEARTGQLDSAWVRLSGPLLTAAMADTGDVGRHHDYPYERDGLWVNGRFDGWCWYVARARAEVALQRGDWTQARAAASRAMEFRRYSGKDALLLAVTSAQVGDLAFSEAAASYAGYLEPVLPEAHYLLGLHLWRAGKRTAAAAAFRSAQQADSGFAAAALALARLRLPGSRPDSLPRHFLTGLRRSAELTSSASPKVEEQWQQDTAPMLAFAPHSPLADSLHSRFRLTQPLTIYVQCLIDEGGTARAFEMPAVPREELPLELVHHMARDLQTWRFVAPTRFGRPIPAWVTAEYVVRPLTAAPEAP